MEVDHTPTANVLVVADDEEAELVECRSVMIRTVRGVGYRFDPRHWPSPHDTGRNAT